VRATVTSRGVTFLRPRQDEKTEQASIVNLLAQLGAAVYVLGTRRATACGLCGGPSTDRGTRQTPGIPDLFAILPAAPTTYPQPGTPDVPVWIEVKGNGGMLALEQATFKTQCEAAGLLHIVGGVDQVVAALELGGWIRTTRQALTDGRQPHLA
jgi:hypothetical protein